MLFLSVVFPHRSFMKGNTMNLKSKEICRERFPVLNRDSLLMLLLIGVPCTPLSAETATVDLAVSLGAPTYQRERFPARHDAHVAVVFLGGSFEA